MDAAIKEAVKVRDVIGMVKLPFYAGLLFALVTAALPQARPAAAPPSKFHANAGEVLVDLVVTDAHGKIIPGIRPGQLEVLDNHQPQKILSFRRVSQSVNLSRSPLAGGNLSAALRLQPFNLILLVFDRMNVADRVLARQTAGSFIQHNLGRRDYVAVFTIDQKLYALQDFTLDKPRLLRAIAAATSGTSTHYRRQTLNGQDMMVNALQEVQVALATRTPEGPNGVPGPPDIAHLIDGWMKEAVAHSLLSAAAMKGQQSSWATLTALRSIVRAMQPLTGRKELVYFSRNLPVDANTGFMLRNLVRDANRAQVSFYTVDPEGLSTISSSSEMLHSLNYAAGVSYANANSVPAGPGGITQEQANEFQAVANVKYSGRLSTMYELASETGGFLAAHTNNLAPYMRRLAGDINGHYELTYAPHSGLNGAWHAISIRIPGHPDWRVRARKGYYAVPRTASPVAAYAAPALALLQQPQPAHDFPFGIAGYQFPENPRAPTLDLIAAVPLAGLKPYPAPAAAVAKDPKLKDRDLVRIVVMQMVRDRRGRIVRNYSHQYEWSLPPGGLARFASKTMVLHRSIHLPAGEYSLQTAIYDPHNHAASVRTTALHVTTAMPQALRLSSIVLVSGTSPLRTPPAHYDPLNVRTQGQLLHIFPNAGNVLAPVKGQPMGFYFIAYLPKGAAPAKVAMTFFRGYRHFQGGVPFSGLNGPLPAPDARGHIPVFARIASNALPPGQYELRVKVEAGALSATRRLAFSVASPASVGPHSPHD